MTTELKFGDAVYWGNNLCYVVQIDDDSVCIYNTKDSFFGHNGRSRRTLEELSELLGEPLEPIKCWWIGEDRLTRATDYVKPKPQPYHKVISKIKAIESKRVKLGYNLYYNT